MQEDKFIQKDFEMSSLALRHPLHAVSCFVCYALLAMCYMPTLNNNLHIWELGEIMRGMPTGEITPEGKKIYYKVLAPTEIVDANKSETTTTDLNQASVIAALNGPMAHIYVKGTNDWNADSQP